MPAAFTKIDNQPLSEKVKNVLLKMMKDGAFGRSGRLPSEDKLAENLGVSRTVIRDVLASF
ncbi:MAG TPA: GntR family transcriptional regulator, partial [Proteobacteria bacterium]|nr:GntR family transcriptional regulator [Pseudomonadota bacterium]